MEEHVKHTRVAIIDSGISRQSRCRKNIIDEYFLSEKEGDLEVIHGEADDTDGHGTAISDIIFQQDPNVEILNFKIQNEKRKIVFDDLCKMLEYIDKKMDVDIINVSAGVTYIEDFKRLECVCERLHQKGVLILSAFDNLGAVSYPAALDSTLGVDLAGDIENLKKKDIVWVFNSSINILVPEKYYRTIFSKGEKAILKGTSFACAEITGKISASFYDENGMKVPLEQIFSNLFSYTMTMDKMVPVLPQNFSINKAILFPVNKEAHALLRYKNMLSFELSGIYDERITGLVGTELYGNKIDSYSNIDWESDFDTIILSCCSRLSKLTKKDYVAELLEKAKQYGKNIYTFEQIDSDYKKVFYPGITKKNVPVGNMGKLRKISMPLVGVAGTSKSQGKYTLQLELKQMMEQKGFKTGMLATEPSGYLFGADSVFHFGFEADLDLKNWEYIQILNELVWNMEKKGYDIAITGGQSGTLHYDNSNVNNFTFAQQLFLYGTQADFYVLCVNPHDDLSYVQRTIQFLNAINEGNVYAIALYPVRAVETANGMQFKKEQLAKDEILACKEWFSANLKLPVYEIGNREDMNQLTSFIIKTFNGEDGIDA